jgi:hypothetical protein
LLTKRELASLLVGWSRTNDMHLADDDGCLTDEVCHPADRGAVRRAARIVHLLRQRFSYLEAPMFQRSLAGKGASFRQMKRRLEDDPKRRAVHACAFDGALSSVLTSGEAYDLVPNGRHVELDTLVELLRGLGNPA